MSDVALSFAAALVLSGFHAFTPGLLRLPVRYQVRLASFSGGAGLAYVFLYLLAAPLVGCAAAAALAVSEGVLYGLLAVVAGGTIINVVRRELPEVQSFRPLAFIAGVATYALLIFATWRF